MENLGEILSRLHAAGAQFVLIGGLAALQHGASYATDDVDICVPLNPENVRQIEKPIEDLHPRFRQRKDLPFALDNQMLAEMRNLDLLTDLGPLDGLGEIAGVGDYQAALAESQTVDLPFWKIQLLRIGALTRAKEAIGRPQDHFVVTQLKAIQERFRQQESS